MAKIYESVLLARFKREFVKVWSGIQSFRVNFRKYDLVSKGLQKFQIRIFTYVGTESLSTNYLFSSWIQNKILSFSEKNVMISIHHLCIFYP